MEGVRLLSDSEIGEFIKSLDKNSNNSISYSELEWKLDQVHKELTPRPLPHHLNHKDRDDNDRHVFLRSIIGSDKNDIPVEEFKETVKGWTIPSMEQDKQAAKDEDNYLKSMKPWRRFRVYWAVKGPEICFIALVVALTVGMSVWQMVKYITETQYRAAFGWGVVLAKACAGAIYAPLFFLLLSMSRYFSTLMRKNYYISRFVNWDVSQSFHIKISCAVIVLATLHAIGHLSGSFVFGSKPNREDNVAALLGPDAVPRPYIDYVRSTPGWTGLTALGCFYLLAALSMPQVRKWNYEVFQLGHLLMFPIIGLLAAHGTSQFLQFAMLGYWLSFPAVLVILERLLRVLQGFHHIEATIQTLDDETVCVTANIPNLRPWPFKAGQYVFLQVPSLSFFQWHPFTVSTCRGNSMQLHVKNDGDWTGKLFELAKTGNGAPVPTQVGIDGPFGAPAQRFHDFDFSIVVGAGIGVTPFSGILTDLQQQEDECVAQEQAEAKASQLQVTASASSDSELVESKGAIRSTATETPRFRRIDFHWLVRDRSYLLWFSELLNKVTRSQIAENQSTFAKHLDVNIVTHVSRKRKDISTHVFRWLLEKHRTPSHPNSPLTGLLNETHFGRPDLNRIMEKHYEEMCALKAGAIGAAEFRENKAKTDYEVREATPHVLLSDDQKKDLLSDLKVGVFFCGPPVIGYQLADSCWKLTARGREEGTRIEYYFMMEVFG